MNEDDRWAEDLAKGHGARRHYWLLALVSHLAVRAVTMTNDELRTLNELVMVVLVGCFIFL